MTATTTVTNQGGRYLGLTLFSVVLVGLAAVLVIAPEAIVRGGSMPNREWLRICAAALLGLAVMVVASVRNPGGPAAASITTVVFAVASVGAMIWSRVDGHDTIDGWFFALYIVVMAVTAGLVALGAKTELVASTSAPGGTESSTDDS